MAKVHEVPHQMMPSMATYQATVSEAIQRINLSNQNSLYLMVLEGVACIRNWKIKMSDDRHFARINVLEIKTLIGKKLGAQKAEKYYDLLHRLLSRKLSKFEFDKHCVAAIGRENIRLHNHLISSILKNACLSKTSPPKGSKPEISINYQRNCLQSLYRSTFPQSPRRGRTPSFRDRRIKDRHSPLGPFDKPHNVSAASEDLAPKAQEQQSATELLSLGSRPLEVNSVEDGEEVDQAAGSLGIHSRIPFTAPLGIPTKVKGSRKSLSVVSSSAVVLETCQGSGELPDTRSLRLRLEQKLEIKGIKISLDCVNLLNNGLDVFLKRLVKPSLYLSASRLGNGQQDRVIAQTVSGLNEVRPVRMLDFRTALELNPTILGEDWPIQLEKVCLREPVE
ncbi:hypothetical protein Nepgr_008207 [Nepenthes gracilis]|uniref:Uncharacterized protein n=1 Tax=Nepenthes gracilis TaxID=150966 RepID=A0AAD3S8C0_NEPGR|nr:hypothetical protein Nepgr_008207 [Nepenthes gracilis]